MELIYRLVGVRWGPEPGVPTSCPGDPEAQRRRHCSSLPQPPSAGVGAVACPLCPGARKAGGSQPPGLCAHSRIEWVWLHWSEYLLARDDFYRWFQKMVVALEPPVELQLGLKEKQWQLSHAQVLLHNVDNQAVLLDRLLEEAGSLFNRIGDPSVDEDAQKRMKAEYDAVKAKAQVGKVWWALSSPVHPFIHPCLPIRPLICPLTIYPSIYSPSTTTSPTPCHPPTHPPPSVHLPPSYPLTHLSPQQTAKSPSHDPFTHHPIHLPTQPSIRLPTSYPFVYSLIHLPPHH